ncbi:nucleoside 2-deoxyribosyltransferase domain-containing protein [Actinacidiphila acididurans]|uniref:Nucleoside 2-deoxyribosyltransferase domain-containing protein n=1 Tax=Actinacidiphila acididurans TaxID=2784346 RepID=A0ABS2TZS6_9ACTN|nr:nucleoside 2-deoxyribosyltransferase domain-containing protein [Actinacidiphila acididurans]MBM9508847.1 nucleoside 2-deoxyribosyltransferase domain-containing protein [Actinacidiphila acididurans]
MAGRRYYEAPDRYVPDPADPVRSVFLAGGITHCPPWQSEAAAGLGEFVVLNPRRADFDVADPGQTDDQIAWEFHHLWLADLTLFWFPACDPALTVQPITLYELGAAAATPTRQIVVGTDPAYPRATDVRLQLTHARPGLTVHSTLTATVTEARRHLAQ